MGVSGNHITDLTEKYLPFVVIEVAIFPAASLEFFNLGRIFFWNFLISLSTKKLTSRA